MPRTAQQGTTTNLRRLAGRRSPVAAPHIPLEPSELPPVLFRLPEVPMDSRVPLKPGLPAASGGSSTPSQPQQFGVPHQSPNLPGASVATGASSSSAIPDGAAEAADGGQNVFNHVAGAVTGAVAGTVANGVAVAGSLAGSALAATPFGTAHGARPSFSSVASSLASPVSAAPQSSAEAAALVRPAPVVRPTPEGIDADKRSWWEHWSSGIILMLLILALVTAGIMAIRDPERTRSTQRSIADEAKPTEPLDNSAASEMKSEKKSEKPFDFDRNFAADKTPGAPEAKPELAGSQEPNSSTPAASASLGPSLLPDTNQNQTSHKASARVPSFTLGPNNREPTGFAANTSETGAAQVADPSGFVSSAQPSPGAAASEGSASRFAAGRTSENGTNGTPAISASTQLGTPQADGFEATVPATAPNLTWPVDDSQIAAPLLDEQASTAPRSTQEMAAGPAVTPPELLPAVESAPNTSAPNTSAPAPAVAVAPSATPAPAARAAYLETALPNEDLESILALRRQALANSRVVSNQYYVSPDQPSGGQVAGGQVAGGMGMNAPAAQPQAYYPQVSYPQVSYPQGAYPTSPSPGQPQVYPAATYPAQYPVQPNMTPNYGAQPSTGYPAAGVMNGNSYPSNAATPNAATSQTIGTRSWTYNPNSNTVPSSWTLAAPNANPSAMNPAASMPPQSNAMSTGQGMQIDPNLARQLGYGQPNTTGTPNITAPNITAPNRHAPNTSYQGGYSSGIVR